MGEFKFKEGDRVLVMDGSKIHNYSATWIQSMEAFVGRAFTVEAGVMIGGMPSYRLDRCPYLFDERGLVLFEEKHPVINIYTEGRKVIAKDAETGKTGVAKCCPEDTFDFMTGAKLALERLSYEMARPKFKVGDRVIGNSLATARYGVTKEGWIGEVVDTTSILGEITVATTDGEHSFNVLEKYFDLANDRIVPGDRVTVIDSGRAIRCNKIEIVTELTDNPNYLARFDCARNAEGVRWLKDHNRICRVLAANDCYALIVCGTGEDVGAYLVGINGLSRFLKNSENN